jgi:pre-mRNA-splicing factor ATP-dependent RNA helicase DHX16
MSKYRKEETSSEDSDSEEERRKKDIKERDSFASRLRAKDESKIRKVAMPAGSGAGKLIRKYTYKHQTYKYQVRKNYLLFKICYS